MSKDQVGDVNLKWDPFKNVILYVFAGLLYNIQKRVFWRGFSSSICHVLS